jgi:hypothetical protein
VVVWRQVNAVARVQEFRSVRIFALYSEENLESGSAGGRYRHDEILAVRREKIPV